MSPSLPLGCTSNIPKATELPNAIRIRTPPS
jgi:hypothetical protein